MTTGHLIELENKTGTRGVLGQSAQKSFDLNERFALVTTGTAPTEMVSDEKHLLASKLRVNIGGK
jgi:hypothetical protein